MPGCLLAFLKTEALTDPEPVIPNTRMPITFGQWKRNSNPQAWQVTKSSSRQDGSKPGPQAYSMCKRRWFLALSPLPDVMEWQESLRPQTLFTIYGPSSWPFSLFKEGYVLPPCKCLLYSIWGHLIVFILIFIKCWSIPIPKYTYKARCLEVDGSNLG